METPKTKISLSMPALQRFLFWAVLLTAVVCAVTQTTGWITGHHRLFGLTGLFYMDNEQSFPTWLNALINFIPFLLARALAVLDRPNAKNWWWLGWIFLVLSIDEIAGLHEILGMAVKARFHTAGFFYFAFVIPGAIFALATFMVFAGLLRRLPKKTSLGMIVSGGMFLTGVLVIESIAGNWSSLHGQENPVYFALVIAEESLEMLAMLLMSKTLSGYLGDLSPTKTLTLELNMRAK